MILGSYFYLGRVTRMSILSVDHSVNNGHLATVSYSAHWCMGWYHNYNAMQCTHFILEIISKELGI